MTQEDIEDIMVYAATKGISVLKIGVPKDVLAEYNGKTYLEERILLEEPNIMNYQRGNAVNGCVQIVALDE